MQPGNFDQYEQRRLSNATILAQRCRSALYIAGAFALAAFGLALL